MCETDWKNKLVAFFHDPPHKPVQIKDHEEQRASFLNRLGLPPDAFRDLARSHDWQAAAADRLLFPDPARSGLRSDWAQNDLEFRHPLGGGRLTPGVLPATAAVLEEELVSALDGIAPESEDWKKKFVLAWRLWPERSAREKNPHLAYLVADTRIPDHTLWHHNALAAAFSVCGSKPAFLLFQIGPVQEFIAQARKTQDLWAGSYLLSYLIAQAQLAIADAIGPEVIIYPQLRGSPLADWHWWKQGILGENQRLRALHVNELLTPNLPNRFLALVPADWRNKAGKTLPQLAEDAVRNTWQTIAHSVRRFIQETVGQTCPGWDQHWDAQVTRFPMVDWVVHEWSTTQSALEQAAAETDPVPPLHGKWTNHPLNHAHAWATQLIPPDERESYGPNSNAAFAWALHSAVTDWKFAARKNARCFAPWRPIGSQEIAGIPKDHLDGRNEVLGGPEHEAFWRTVSAKLPADFKGSQLYGALSVIKRLYPQTYLHNTLGWKTWKPDFKSVPEIARIEDAFDWDKEEATGSPYYAVLSMDGDDLGQWVGGTKAPPLLNQLSGEAQGYLRQHWPNADLGLPPVEEVQRPLSPGYHAALSEALANFSLYCAGPIVRQFGGQLIYSGGDDVLAMVPAWTALDCAQALQLVFRGLNPNAAKSCASQVVQEKLNDLFDYSRHVDGFVTLKKTNRGDVGRSEHLKPNYPLLVMGPRASASVGLAVGHVRSPMQDTIQAARNAEQKAKSRFKNLGKGAFCLAVQKRSGEAAEFAARWDAPVGGVWAELSSAIHDQSNRFAYRYLQLIRPLLASTDPGHDQGWEPAWNDDLVHAVAAELRHVLIQQAGQERGHAERNTARWIKCLIGAELAQPHLAPRDFIHFWMAWAFVRRLA